MANTFLCFIAEQSFQITVSICHIILNILLRKRQNSQMIHWRQEGMNLVTGEVPLQIAEQPSSSRWQMAEEFGNLIIWNYCGNKLFCGFGFSEVMSVWVYSLMCVYLILFKRDKDQNFKCHGRAVCHAAEPCPDKRRTEDCGGDEKL